ncbi:AsmA-like C-terminal region-containing protein, partial [Klebsiella pneumoniae]|uniref:AsmA-like C-terminal region-containing protein n=1 Tax=Klebsiella pneumoniae TaxID=573 RepID=UPI00215DB352
MDAKISVGRLHCLNSDITDASGLFIYRPNHMRLVNVAGKLFGGEILSQLEVMGGRNVSYQSQQKLTDIDIASLLLSRINVAYLSGKATAFITAQSMGKNIKTLLANLSGNMQLNVQHGMISGIESKQLLVLKADRQSRKLINK